MDNITTLNLGDDSKGYNTLKYEIISVKNGKSYQLSYRFHYTESYSDGSPDKEKFFTTNLPVTTSPSTLSGNSIIQEISGEEVYISAEANIGIPQGNVKSRKFNSLEFFVTVAGEELNTYLEVNKPSEGISQEKPEYTNIDNGIGIFSSRITVFSPFKKQISASSLTELKTGQYTKNLGFN